MKTRNASFETKAETTRRIDTALSYLILKNASSAADSDQSPETMTLNEIADFVGADPMVIRKAEQSALAKIWMREKEDEHGRRVADEYRRKEHYNHWLQEMPAKLSQGGFSSLCGKDRDELFLIYQLLMNGGELNQTQKRLLEIALADPATSKFLELRGSQGNMPSPTTSLSPQMTGAFSALGIAGAAGIMQRGQIRQELNEFNENLADNGGGDAGGGGEASGDFGGFM